MTSSVQFALHGIERAYHWGYGDRNFANGETVCARPLSRCGLYGGNIWVPAAAGHLFGNGTATVLANVTAGVTGADGQGSTDGGMVAAGIGGWGDGGELRLLVSLFHPRKDLHGPGHVSVAFDRPQEWGPAGTAMPPLKIRTMTLNQTTSVYDAIYRDAVLSKALADPADPNIYTLKKMLTAEGVASVKANGEKWLAVQQAAYYPSGWTPYSVGHADGDGGWAITCDGEGRLCSAATTVSPPAVEALWVDLQ